MMSCIIAASGVHLKSDFKSGHSVGTSCRGLSPPELCFCCDVLVCVILSYISSVFFDYFQA